MMMMSHSTRCFFVWIGDFSRSIFLSNTFERGGETFGTTRKELKKDHTKKTFFLKKREKSPKNKKKKEKKKTHEMKRRKKKRKKKSTSSSSSSSLSQRESVLSRFVHGETGRTAPAALFRKDDDDDE